MKTAIVNIGTIIIGNWREPFAERDTILMADGKISSVGTVDATAIPGLIDS